MKPLRMERLKSLSSSLFTGIASLCAFGLAACSSTASTVSKPQPTFVVNVIPGSVTLTDGTSGVAVSLLATGEDGFASTVNVTISGLPAGVSVQPSTIALTPGTPSAVTLSAAANSAAASSVAQFTATSGTLTQIATLTVNVALAPDFALSLTPQTLNLNQAQTGQTFQVTAAPLNGFTGNISVALSNLPAGVTATPANLTLAPGVAQPVTLTASSTATLGTGSATVTANSGALTHSGSVNLAVYLAGIINGPFTHPGIWHSMADLNRMKTQVAAGVEPYKSAYAYFSNMGYSLYTNTGQGPFVYETYAHGQFEIRNDAQVAHQNAVMWYITGDTRYRDNAIQIMNAWASTLTAFDITDVLTAGTCIRDFANAGEIIRATGNGAWAPADITKFQNMLLNLIYPALVGSTPVDLTKVQLYPAGFGGLQTAGLITLGVFCDRADIYNFAVTTYQHHAQGSIGLHN